MGLLLGYGFLRIWIYHGEHLERTQKLSFELLKNMKEEYDIESVRMKTDLASLSEKSSFQNPKDFQLLSSFLTRYHLLISELVIQPQQGPGYRIWIDGQLNYEPIENLSPTTNKTKELHAHQVQAKSETTIWAMLNVQKAAGFFFRKHTLDRRILLVDENQVVQRPSLENKPSLEKNVGLQVCHVQDESSWLGPLSNLVCNQAGVSESKNIEKGVKAVIPVSIGEKVYELVAFIPWSEVTQSQQRMIYVLFTIVGIFTAGVLALFALLRKTWAQMLKDQQQTQAHLAYTARLTSIGEMAAGIAHEINNPLAVIGGCAQVIARESTSASPRHDMIEKNIATVQRTVDRIAKIINALKSFSRDGTEQGRESIPAQVLIDEALEFVRQRFANHGIELNIATPDADLIVEVNLVQVGQVFVNVLNNAHDAVLETPPDQKRQVALKIRSMGPWIDFLIEDTGPGINPDVEKKMFQPFFSTKAIGRGTGLGLSVSIGIMQDHGGDLVLENRKNPTRFVLRLPRAQSMTHSPQKAA